MQDAYILMLEISSKDLILNINFQNVAHLNNTSGHSQKRSY